MSKAPWYDRLTHHRPVRMISLRSVRMVAVPALSDRSANTNDSPDADVPRNQPRAPCGLFSKQPTKADRCFWSTRTQALTVKAPSGRPEQPPSCAAM